MGYNLKDSLNKDFRAENPTLYHLSLSLYDTMLPVLEDLWDKLLNKGFTKEQAAGIIGNAILESKLDSSLRGGIFQFRGSNLKYYNSHYPDYSLDNQIDFLLKWKDGEMKEPEGWYHDTTRAYNKSDHSTPEASAQAFYTTFEKANNGTDKLRLNYARRVYDYFASKLSYLDFFQSGGVASNRTYKQRVKENAQNLWEKIKTNPYVNTFIPLEDFSEGNLLAAVPYMIPGGGGIKQVAKLPKFTFTDYMNQGKKRALKVINDAEYQEALYKVTRDPIILEAQRNGINKAQLAEEVSIQGFPPYHSGLLSTSQPQTKFLDRENPMISVEEFKLRVKKANNLKSDQELFDYLEDAGMDTGPLKRVPIITMSSDFLSVVESGKYTPDEIRSLFSHESHHAALPGPVIWDNNAKYPVKLNSNIETTLSPRLRDYYLNPDELRSRAMELRRLHQTTGKSYEELLNTWETIPHRDNPNINDLIKYYDRESLLKYLNRFLKDGGTINYLDFFKK